MPSYTLPNQTTTIPSPTSSSPSPLTIHPFRSNRPKEEWRKRTRITTATAWKKSYQFNKMDRNFFQFFLLRYIFFPFDQSIIFSFLTSEWIYNFIIQFLISRSVSYCSDWIWVFSWSIFFSEFISSFLLLLLLKRMYVILKENQIAALFHPKCIHR